MTSDVDAPGYSGGAKTCSMHVIHMPTYYQSVLFAGVYVFSNVAYSAHRMQGSLPLHLFVVLCRQTVSFHLQLALARL